ncbi:cytochrome P450 [Gordonia bronchialis DSM 43247]|uniref:Cytochrome P450 n=2 Tax=Gordonia bronchialis TaxID=2054 RepID=D0LDX1_GORB4|nr:cytochrome P450 [Gordonia bronchialis DSM 43247]STQ64632.1 Putative cytochrome P450 120 [Gordonia bronchialis]
MLGKNLLGRTVFDHPKRTMQSGLGAISKAYPSSPRPLAEPPAGSGLKPVLGDPGLPLLGNTLEALADPLRSAMQRYERYGPVTWSGSLGMNIVTLVGPEAIECAWMNREKAFSSEQGWEPMIGPFFRRGVMLMDFEEHMHHRRILQQAFTTNRLKGYLGMMTPHIEKTLANWPVGEGFPMYSRTKDLTLSLATEVFVGASLNEAEAHRLETAFEAAVRGGQAIIRADVKFGTWARGLRGREALQRYFRSEIAARRAGDGDDLFSVLCHSESPEGDTFTDEDVVNHMIFVMMAAHDTSTIALSMLTYFLGRHPEWQDRLRAESLALGKDTLDYEDIDALTSLDLAFKETIRINAPVGMLFRKAVRDTDILGHYVPAGTLVAIHPWATMLREEWWPNPTHWDPERFSPERREDKVHRFAWAPFGGGAHKCIGLYFGGMEVKAIMHQMLQRFEWSVPAGYFPELEYGTGPTPADGLPIDFRRR